MNCIKTLLIVVYNTVTRTEKSLYHDEHDISFVWKLFLHKHNDIRVRCLWWRIVFKNLTLFVRKTSVAKTFDSTILGVRRLSHFSWVRTGDNVSCDDVYCTLFIVFKEKKNGYSVTRHAFNLPCPTCMRT